MAKHGVEYLISWKGFEKRSWVRASYLKRPIEILEEFFTERIHQICGVLDFKQNVVERYDGGL